MRLLLPAVTRLRRQAEINRGLCDKEFRAWVKNFMARWTALFRLGPDLFEAPAASSTCSFVFLRLDCLKRRNRRWLRPRSLKLELSFKLKQQPTGRSADSGLSDCCSRQLLSNPCARRDGDHRGLATTQRAEWGSCRDLERAAGRSNEDRQAFRALRSPPWPEG